MNDRRKSNEDNNEHLNKDYITDKELKSITKENKKCLNITPLKPKKSKYGDNIEKFLKSVDKKAGKKSIIADSIRMKKLSKYWAKIKTQMDKKGVDALEIPIIKGGKKTKKKVIIREENVYIELILPLKQKIMKQKEFSSKNGFFSKENINKILLNSFEGSSSEENIDKLFSNNFLESSFKNPPENLVYIPLIESFKHAQIVSSYLSNEKITPKEVKKLSNEKITPKEVKKLLSSFKSKIRITSEEERKVLKFLEKNRENLMNSEKSSLYVKTQQGEYFCLN